TQGSGFVCPEEDIANTGCKGPKDCLYPNPENCQTFIQCTVNADNKTGTPVVMPCPAGLEWNDNIKRCDYPESSTCPKGSTARPTEQTSEAPVETTQKPTESPTPSPTASPTAQPSTEGQTSEQPTTTTTSTPDETTTQSDTTTEQSTTQTPVDTTTQSESESPSTTTTTQSDTTTEQSTTQTPVDTTTQSESESPSTTTTTTITTSQPTESTPLPTCIPDDDSDDSDLDLVALCKDDSCQSTRRTISHPSNNGKYIICSDSQSGNTIQKCGPGLLFDEKVLSCNYAGLVDSRGPSGKVFWH
ncbi:unnamed protein product, partial [Oppiella nova]